MSDFKHVEEQIEGLRCSGSVLPAGTAENIADTMQALLDGYVKALEYAGDDPRSHLRDALAKLEQNDD